MMRSFIRATGLGSLLAVLAAAVAPQAAHAVLFAVTDTADLVDAAPGDGVCSTAAATCTLRAAIQEANALASADQISLPAGTYALTLSGNGEDAAATGDLDVTDNGSLLIIGQGSGNTIVDASGLAPRDRVFHFIDGTAVVRKLQITGGSQNNGGGLRNQDANVTLRQVRVEDNTASFDGGGILNDGVDSRLTIASSSVNDNAAVDNGGGIANRNGAVLTVNATTIDGNEVGDAGGGLYNFLAAIATINGSTISSNLAATVFGLGGGIANIDGTAIVEHTTITGNTAGTGGGIYHQEDQFFATLETFFVIVSHNEATGTTGGGGLFTGDGDVTINVTTVNGNSASDGDGGGLYVDPDTNTTAILQTDVFDNMASDNGGGIAYLGSAGGAGNISLSAIYENDATNGGGIWVSQPANFNMTISKSTISGNDATMAGGGLYLSALAGSIVGLSHLTVAENHAVSAGGGIFVFNNNASYNPYHVLLAENTANAGDNCDGGNLTSSGFNLVEHDDGCSFLAQATDQVGSLGNPIDPRIGALQDNGGVTPTHALLANSPAIDRGHAFMCGSIDQRGMTQPVSECDIGAYELQLP